MVLASLKVFSFFFLKRLFDFSVNILNWNKGKKGSKFGFSLLDFQHAFELVVL